MPLREYWVLTSNPRICPGRYLAERVAMQLAVAVFAKFDILPVDGEVLNPAAIEYEDSTVR